MGTELWQVGALPRTMPNFYVGRSGKDPDCVRLCGAPPATSSAGNLARWPFAGPPPGCLGAERQFRRIIGYQQLASLALAIERDLAPPMTTKEVATLVAA